MNNTIDLEEMEEKLTPNAYIDSKPNAEVKAKLMKTGLIVLLILITVLLVLSLATNDSITRQLFASLSIIIGLSTIRLMSVSTEV